MIDIETATERILNAATAARSALVAEGFVPVELWAASGQTLAEDIVAKDDDPAFDRSAMDGYAYRSGDVDASMRRLRVIGEAPAGVDCDMAVGPGEAIAIMTGAAIPQGGDTVVILENTRRDGDLITIDQIPQAGKNIRRRGENIRAGAVAIPSGAPISGLTVGVLASMGVIRPNAHRRPRVTVMGSGTELVDASEVPGPGQIRDSNRHVLMDLLNRSGVLVVDGGRAEDSRSELARSIRQGMESDILVVSGGVSAGAYDLVANVLASEGVTPLLHKVSMKPGKPLYVGTMGSKMVFGLPGNPVSTYVTAILFLLPALRILAGHPPGPWTTQAELTHELAPTGSRTTFHPGRVELRDGSAKATPIAWRGSADQLGFSKANCLIRADAGSTSMQKGMIVPAILPYMPSL